MKTSKPLTAQTETGETVVSYAPFTCTNCGKATHDLVSYYSKKGKNMIPAGHNWCTDCLKTMFPKNRLTSLGKVAKAINAKHPVEPVVIHVKPAERKLVPIAEFAEKHPVGLVKHAAPEMSDSALGEFADAVLEVTNYAANAIAAPVAEKTAQRRKKHPRPGKCTSPQAKPGKTPQNSPQDEKTVNRCIAQNPRTVFGRRFSYFGWQNRPR